MAITMRAIRAKSGFTADLPAHLRRPHTIVIKTTYIKFCYEFIVQNVMKMYTKFVVIFISGDTVRLFILTTSAAQRVRLRDLALFSSITYLGHEFL